ncbi:hypothetical protein AGABI2DRAFT_121414 [Agaricus bisporus var. bisporus H97]|uniref:hypothetical protein n=1 Tax=Agaricus bisporus var. bisporus (strain H97 / ATCC MYA-4626 / FGSC 10389) TaxID=936046 RepID=UPI00029F707F|nr:hypothetical protein AGABI2DRAFT_121414 [Agaricus bisporus var. bisporus H97]EKV44234.1 hypothetical protein AGABI2DRAFT_121414 [Agaricus bisporus var. bisporus H97]
MSFASLPFELVVRICRINAHRAHHWQDLPRDARKPLQDTIAASQVCSRWRYIVLSAPELWRFAIDPYHPCASWRDLVLKRSEPLSIEFMDSTNPSQKRRPVHDIQLQIQSKMNLRLRRYDMRLEYQAETIPSYLSAWPSEPGSWPQLQRLCLDFDIDPDTELQGNLTHPPGRLPVHFPGLATPILQRLSLTSCYMPDWNGLLTIGNTLTHLEICFPSSRLCPDRCIEMLQNLPDLESLEFLGVLEMLCHHSHSNTRFTLGVKNFVFSELLYSCPPFLDRIELSPKCRSSKVVFLSHAKIELEMSEEDGVTAVLPHLKRFLSRIMTDTSKLSISQSSIMIESGLLVPVNFSCNPFQPVFAEHSNIFAINFILRNEDGTHDTYDRSFLFRALLDLVLPISTFVEFTETWSAAHSNDNFSDDDWDHFLDFLVQCHNLRFMQGVGRSWWDRLCKRLIPVAGEVFDATKPLFPRLQAIEFDRRTRFKEGLPFQWVVDLIPFDELQAFCKHRAKIRVPLERIRFSDGVFQMDASGEIGLEPEPWDPWGLEEGRKRRAQKRGLTGAT